MRQSGLVARQPKRYRVTTNSQHRRPIAPNLVARAFSVTQPNRVWVADITYVQTGEGWLYLAVVIDLFSRMVVGSSMDSSLDRRLCITALSAALARRASPKGLVHHSDRGCQYASADYQAMLSSHDIICSMSRRGDCWDNAVAESFFGTLKTELLRDRRYATRKEARAAIFEYIEVYYNRLRHHSTLGNLSPARWEENYYKQSRA